VDFTIDMSEETLIPVAEVPQKLPPRPSGKNVHVTSVYCWINHGVRGVKLESLKVGGTTYTSTEALQRFAERLSHPRNASTPPYSLTRHLGGLLACGSGPSQPPQGLSVLGTPTDAAKESILSMSLTDIIGH